MCAVTQFYSYGKNSVFLSITKLDHYINFDFFFSVRFWPRERDPGSLLFGDVCPVPSTLKVERNPTTGELLGYNEV